MSRLLANQTPPSDKQRGNDCCHSNLTTCLQLEQRSACGERRGGGRKYDGCGAAGTEGGYKNIRKRAPSTGGSWHGLILNATSLPGAHWTARGHYI